VSQFPVTSDPKPVASDHKDFLPTTTLPTQMDAAVTDDDVWRRPTTNFWSAFVGAECANVLQRASLVVN